MVVKGVGVGMPWLGTQSVLCTEASKLVMSYVAAVCGKGDEVNVVKEQLLQSNPVLEGEHPGSHSVYPPVSAPLPSPLP